MNSTATLVSVNVGQPRDVPWPGRTVHTGIFKSPVLGPVIEFAVSPGFGPIPSIAIRLPGRGPRRGTMPEIPAGLQYSPDHLWARPSAELSLIRVGVTDFAQQSLGDVVDVSPPRIGETIKVGQPCGDIESVKSISDLIAPVTGTVRQRNDDLASFPELVNTDPYGRGWLFEVDVDPATAGQQLAALLDPAAYRELAGA